MSQRRLEWRNGSQGYLALVGQPSCDIADGSELLNLLHGQSQRFSLSEIELLGSCAFFMALRGARYSSPGLVLSSAEKVLDSFYQVIPGEHRDRAFQRGLSNLREHLFLIRGEPGHILIDEAFAFLQRAFGAGAV